MPHAYVKQGTYFQFPLCALAYGRSVTERLNAIIEFGCRHAGRAEWKRMDVREQSDWIERMRRWPSCPKQLDFAKPDDLALVLGAQIIGVTVHDLTGVRKSLAVFDQFLTAFEQLHGRDASVRIKQAYIFEARKGTGLSYRELSVLAAILSVLGRRRVPVEIRQAVIRCRALGYRSATVHTKAMSARTDAAKPLTAWELRATLEALRCRKLVHRQTFGRRRTFYGVGQTAKEFRDALADRLVRGSSGELLRRQETYDFDAHVRNQRAMLRGQPLPVPEAGGSRLPAWEDPAFTERPFLSQTLN